MDFPILHRYRTTADQRRERLGALRRTIRHPDVAHTTFQECAGGALARFAGTEQQHFARLEMSENLFRQIDCDRAD